MIVLLISDMAVLTMLELVATFWKSYVDQQSRGFLSVCVDGVVKRTASRQEASSWSRWSASGRLRRRTVVGALSRVEPPLD